MIEIDDFTIGVENETELRTYVGSNLINYIYLVNNIAITGGITIDPDKASLVIDGEWPRESGIIHTFTDIEGTDYNNTIGIRSTSNITLTFRNMVISGHNYFGVPFITENIALITDTSGVSVIYENVTYQGPQITYNRYGLTRYIDCTINIMQNGSTQSQEAGEVNRVEIGGQTTIYHTSNVNNRAVFWFNNLSGTSSFTVLSGAEVDINSVYSYFMYNYEGIGLIHAPVTYTLQPGSSLRLTAYQGISFNSYHTLNSFLVDENASFYYVQTGDNGTNASLYLDSSLEVRRSARFYMQAANGTQPLIRFTSGTNRRLTVNNPSSFVLYNPNAAALNAQSTTAFTLYGGQLNTWSTAITPVTSAGGFNDEPEYAWFKANYAAVLEFSGTFTAASTTAVSNMGPDDEPHPLDSALHLHSARVISIGDWPIETNPIVDDGRPVTGQTEPNANMQIEYDTDGIEHSIDGAADNNGDFTISTSEEEPQTIPAGTEVAVWSNIPFLIKYILTRSLALGELTIQYAPEQIVFTLPPISLNPPILSRINPYEEVIIGDTRADVSQWTLFASVSGPLKTESGETLPDAVVFLETADGTPVTLSEEPIPVFTGGPEVPTTSIFWPENAGILVRITDIVRSGAMYSTDIVWILRAI